MPDRPDLPAVATPWTDPLGNVWCAVPSSLEEPEVKVFCWIGGEWGCPLYNETAFVHPALLAGLGRTLPEGPTPAPTPRCAPRPRSPKRVAKVVRYGAWELAARGEFLFDRDWGSAGDVGNWHPAQHWAYDRTFITIAAEAFAGAGDVLPGEAE